ncbi:MAG: pyridoxamine 5'-phosphate oxidase family protein [Caldilineaceae bacterium]
MTSHTITTVAQLRELYRAPSPAALANRCVFPTLDSYHRAFIALSPFLVISSASPEGLADVSPRGDQPGFVAVPDERTLLIPDRPGNRKIETLQNIVENPNVAVVFLVPGRVETLRVTGKALITTDPALLAPLSVEEKTPQCAIMVTLDQVYFHCGKALVRSRLWDPAVQAAAATLPSFGCMMAGQIAGIAADEVDEGIAEYYQTTLW